MDEISDVSTVLRVSLITDVLGSFLTVQELKTCRRVSKNWCNWFGPSFRKKAKLVLCDLNDFWQIVQHPDDSYHESPHKQVVIKLNDLEGLLLNRFLSSFWTTHAQNLTYLRLEKVENCEDDILYDFLYRQTPNLKTLILTDCFRELGRGRMFFDQMMDIPEDVQQHKLKHLEIERSVTFLRREDHIELLKILLQIYPNITTLRLNRYLDGMLSGQNSLEKVFTYLAEIQKTSPDKYKLKELDILFAYKCEDCIELPFLQALENVNFPLEKLTIDFGSETKVKVAAGILNLYRETLQKLDIFRSGSAALYTDFPFGIEFPCLKVLSISDRVAGSLRFLKMMPNLETLHVCGWTLKCEFMSIPASTCGSGGNTGESGPNLIERTTMDEMKDVKVMLLKEFSYAYAHTTIEMRKNISKWLPHSKIKMFEYL